MVFKKMNPSELKPFASVPQCLDNQWASNTAIQIMHKTGRSRVDMEEELKPAVRRGFMRALLQSDQVIVNRAYFHNCRTLSDMYMDTGERESLSELLSETAIVPYFMGETDPLEPVIFDTDDRKERWVAWKDLCSGSDLNCLRLSWDDKVNAQKTRDLLALRYQEFISNLQFRSPSLFCRDFGLEREKFKEFGGVLRDVARTANDIFFDNQSWDDLTEDNLTASSYVTRADLYKKFVCPDDAPVNDGYIDNEKPFSAQIKQLIDLRYNINLPDALDRYTVTASDSIGRHVLQEYDVFNRGPRLDTRELGRVIGDIIFNLAPQSFEPEEFHRLHLSDILALRRDPLFDNYIKSVQRALPKSNILLSESELFKNPTAVIQNLTSNYMELIKEGGRRALVKSSGSQNWRPKGEMVVHFVGTALSMKFNLDGHALFLPEMSKAVVNSGPAGIVVEYVLSAKDNVVASHNIGSEYSLRVPLLKGRVDDAQEAIISLREGIEQTCRDLQVIEFNSVAQASTRLGGYEPRDIEIDNP